MSNIDFDLIQHTYLSVLKNKRQKAKATKISVAFFVSQRQLWSAQSVYNELEKTDLFEPIIVVFPNMENRVKSNIDTCNENYSFFNSKNMNVIYGYDILNNCYLSYEYIKADIVFFDQPYPRLPEDLRWPQIYKNTLVCYIPYGYKIAGFYEAHFNEDLQNSCWAIFAESHWHKEQFSKYGPLNGKNVVISGYPKLDAYLKDDVQTDIWKISVKVPKTNVKKIIWAPHWSINEIHYSTFHENYQFFLEFAKKNKNTSWIFKPHQRLKHHLVETGFMEQKEVEEYYQEWNNLENGYYFNESDYFNLFKTSDALITDCGSFLAEYLPTKKPIIHLINPESKGYNEIGEQITKTYYKAQNTIEIDTFINDVIINENDFLKEQRLSKLSLVQPNLDGAGKFICKYLEKKLML